MKFLLKILSNLAAMLIAIGLLFAGCVYIVGTGVQQADKAMREAQARNAKRLPPAVREQGGQLPARVAPPPPAGFMEQGKRSFAQSVAADLIAQYEIVAAGDDELAKATRAGAVAEMYLQARDEAHYRAWKARSDEHMKRFVPR